MILPGITERSYDSTRYHLSAHIILPGIASSYDSTRYHLSAHVVLPGIT